ncbi:hypothetical protein MU582_16790 [Nocardioidaceae bacterium SCSIO 66511]|nr:hypothetical protein MU582_16790 [Nocardioidaceae bacterium SCSIO 66511]
MPIATFKDLVIDVSDAERMSGFWASALGLDVYRYDTDDIVLRGPTPQHGVWINQVPEPRTVKQRVHIDVHAASVAEYEGFGATVLPEWSGQPWTVMGDPEGGEMCVFVREQVPAYRLYEIGVDSRDPVRIATWWADVLGARMGREDEEDFAYVDEIPGAPFDSIDFAAVPEPKTVKNRIHWDVTVDSADALEDLKGAGATVLRARDPEIGWTVMADPEGNEFCVFTD